MITNQLSLFLLDFDSHIIRFGIRSRLFFIYGGSGYVPYKVKMDPQPLILSAVEMTEFFLLISSIVTVKIRYFINLLCKSIPSRPF
jgi:hypothetical protein